jgi:hypothetical protein
VSFFGVIRVFRGPLALRRGSSKRRKNAWTFVLLILIIRVIRVIRGFKNRKIVLTYFTAFR